MTRESRYNHPLPSVLVGLRFVWFFVALCRCTLRLLGLICFRRSFLWTRGQKHMEVASGEFFARVSPKAHLTHSFLCIAPPSRLHSVRPESYRTDRIFPTRANGHKWILYAFPSVSASLLWVSAESFLPWNSFFYGNSVSNPGLLELRESWSQTCIYRVRRKKEGGTQF